MQFLHNVELVEPSVGDRKWMIKVKDLKRNIILEESFDAVMVCNGHYFEPSIPNLKGQKIFQGEQLHSHDYKVPDIFTDKTVVVLGAGPSGNVICDLLFFIYNFINIILYIRKIFFC